MEKQKGEGLIEQEKEYIYTYMHMHTYIHHSYV